MKNTIIYLLLALFAISGCKKYDEGPAISLRSKEKRLCQEWKLDKYLVNGEDFDYFEEQIWTFDKNGTLKVYINYGTYDEEAEFEWKWANKKEDIEIFSLATKDKSFPVVFQGYKNVAEENRITVQIKKLKFDEFVLENTEEGETIRFEFVK